MLQTANIICTGGAGTLGKAIAERRKREGWSGKLTVYSTDTHKHEVMRRSYPDVNFIQGDIRHAETLYNAMVGHDTCLHLAAVKVIPASELYSLDTIDVNINGSVNVCVQAINAGISHVLGISTDKSAHPANAYGATKYLMEKIFQEYARVFSGGGTQFHLTRYGNVLESTGSVIEAWRNALAASKPILVTDPEMTRFWLSPQQAVDLVIESLQLPSGHIYIPRMKALSIGKLAEYVLGSNVELTRIPLRPGEKTHECLLTIEEVEKAFIHPDYYDLHPTTSDFRQDNLLIKEEYTSDIAPELSRESLMELLRNE